MTDQPSLFNEAAPTPAISASKVSFLQGLFATWSAREHGRAAPNSADKNRALSAAEAALRELAATDLPAP